MRDQWTIALAQIDCRFADVEANREHIRHDLCESARQGAHLAIFPECAVTGYAFTQRADAVRTAEPVPGPTTEMLASECKQHGLFAIVGLLEYDASTDRLFNTAVLVGPNGYLARYRKTHLPCLGVDRFTTPGDEPFAIHDLGGLRIGMQICFDNGFPEACRVLALLGADLVVLPTNWPTNARNAARYLVPARAIENHVYFAAVNRIGEEHGFHFIGQSQLVDVTGEPLTHADHDKETLLLAAIEPAKARQKRVVYIPGEYEVDRVGSRRPALYGRLTAE